MAKYIKNGEVREAWERDAVLREKDTSSSLEFEFHGDGTTMREEEKELGCHQWLKLILLQPPVALDLILTE